MSNPLSFAATLPATTGTIAGNKVTISVPGGIDTQALAANLQKLNPAASVSASSNVLSVVLPPTIKTGPGPVDLKKLAMTLKHDDDATSVGVLGGGCCGNSGGSGGCCVNLL